MQQVEKDHSPVDEFTLYCLGCMHNTHLIVLTMQEPWSSLSCQFQMTVPEVYAKCHMRLIYLGPGKSAEICSNCERGYPSEEQMAVSASAKTLQILQTPLHSPPLYSG